MNDISKMLIFFGALLIFLGLIFSLAGKLPGFGKLPGDIFIKKDNFTFYFPLTTSILISVILSLILFLWNRR